MFTQVRPAAPIAPWLGGKKHLNGIIIEKIESVAHEAYIEPFVGMGGMLLRRGRRPKLEVMNDRNGEIVNLFRILQRHYPQFLDVMRFQLQSRREFNRLRDVDPATLTDLERAARFLYLQRLGFAGKVNSVFGVSATSASRFSLSRLEPILEAAHERLEAVVFENLDWAEIMRRYDHKGAMFYLDPPYVGGENDYGKGMFDRDQFALMGDVLRRLSGRFVLSINDTPEVREWFAGFEIEPVRLNYSVSSSGSTEAREVIISNFRPQTLLL
ncbi:DNA adenine methylase [Ketogulonicigenium vulgare]|uniref:DNA adenine methylase n=1 Tax=Ketogulonicigenium vulgare TaxID=92945 RepID=UPI00235841E9|nr:DNA adenine methylase [Ketogulonicigenium vulgare]